MLFCIFEAGSIWRHKHTDALLEIIEVRDNTHVVFKNTKQLKHNAISLAIFERQPLELIFPRKTRLVELLYL